jgi:predicted permease
MQIASLILDQMLQFFLMLLLGFIIVKVGLLKANDSKVLSTLSIYIVLPCVIVNAFQIDYNKETAMGLMLAFGAACVIHVLLLVLNTILRRIFHLDVVEQASVIYSNAGNMIIPIVSSVLGPEWVLYSSAFVSVQIILLWTHCKSLLCEEKQFDIKKVLGNINIWAILIGILLFLLRIQLPGIAASTFTSIGYLMAPLGMFVMGMLLAGSDLKSVFGNFRVYIVAVLRLLICPVAVLLVLKASGAATWIPNADTILFISFLACTTPASATITQMAQVYNKNAEEASSVNIVTTLVCLVTMPLLTQLYWMLIG